MPERFAKVSDNLYRGGAPSDSDLKILKNKFGINRIISLDMNVANTIHKTCKDLNIEHIIIDVDGSNPNLNAFYKNINKLISNNKKTYLHCLYGKDRTSAAVAIYKISKGVDLNQVLEEAKKFGMGSDMPEKLKQKYYAQVINFSNAFDNNDANTIVQEQREDNIQAPIQISEMSPAQGLSHPSLAPYSASIDALASSKIYTICEPNNLLKPGNVWFSRAQAIHNIDKSKGKLYSAEISSNADIIKYRQYFNQVLLQNAKINSKDVVQFLNTVIFVLNPNALINIQEEGDNNHISDVGLNVGQHSNYDGLAPYSFPGSGGIMESGYGGFAGAVQLPYTKDI